MKVTEQKSIKKFIQITNDAYLKGWNERNGGNLSHRLTSVEVAEVEKSFNKNNPWCKLPITVSNLANCYFAVTGTGRFFRNVILDVEQNMGIIEINNSGDAYRIVWGLQSSGPTSELPTHLMNHSVKMTNKAGRHHTILHAHCTNLIALTFVLPLDDKIFTSNLWQMATECPVVFPDGVGVTPWMIPGGTDIAHATSAKMEHYDAVVWAHHGLFCSGDDLDITFGLMDTIEKSAEILVKVLSMGGRKQTISNENLLTLEPAFKIKLNQNFVK